jgi:hypothetical protein
MVIDDAHSLRHGPREPPAGVRRAKSRSDARFQAGT